MVRSSRISINDLIRVLQTVPDEAREMPIHSVCGCRNGDTTGFQFELDCGERGHKKYVLIPCNKGDILHDSFGKRES